MPIVPPFHEASRVQLRTLVLIRWTAIIGQAVALLLVHFVLDFTLPVIEAMTAVAASAVVNLMAQWGNFPRRISELSIAGYLAFDIVQLAVLLSLTGGLENPFAFLLLAPVAVSATVLSLKSTAVLCVMALGSITILAIWHLPLPWKGIFPQIPPIYLLGVWTALAIGILFFATYTWRVAQAARELLEALFATQQALAREQQLSVMGGIAAAAAHELGSPLGTIAVTGREIATDLPPNSPIAEDISLLLSEIDRCRDILTKLAKNPEEDVTQFSTIPISVLVEETAQRHGADHPSVEFKAGPFTENINVFEPKILSVPEITHGIGALAQNAVQFANNVVKISTHWSANQIRVVIADDGPGFPSVVLDRIGEPYLSQRLNQGDHMGLGIFIAQTLLGRTGARLSFKNLPSRGAEVEVLWDRTILEQQGKTN